MASLLGIVFAALLVSTPADDAATRREVQATVEGFLSDLGGMRVEKLPGYFARQAVMVVVRKTPQGFSNSFQTVEEWLARVRSNPNPQPFEEPLANVQVTIDSGHLAYLRADFKVIREGKILSSGVDQFTLVKEQEGWKIAAAAYTSIPAEKP